MHPFGEQGLIRQFTRLMLSRLTGTIIFANLLSIAVLLIGSVSLTQYRDGLIIAKQEGVRAQAQVIAAILGQVAADDTQCDGITLDDVIAGCNVSLREDAVNIVFSRVWDSFEGRVRVYNAPKDFSLSRIENARDLLLEDVVLRKDEFIISEPAPIRGIWNRVENIILAIWPEGGFLMQARATSLEDELTRAFLSSPAGSELGVASVRFSEEDDLVASVSVPIRKVQAVYGVVTAEIGGIQDLIIDARRAIMPFVILALATSIFSSIFLTVSIAYPIYRLAAAADNIREGLSGSERHTIPDFEHRQDEIGRLSKSLQMMTGAIDRRIEDIESFAADVSHELKNPLTSIRSAAETLNLISKPEDSDKLMNVIKQDVARMDRLITDISNASRLDAELAREEREKIDLPDFLISISDNYNQRLADSVVVIPPPPAMQADLKVSGSPAALSQIFTNLIDNALSFSPGDRQIILRLKSSIPPQSAKAEVLISVDDSGPGVPPDQIERIFERFYTRRPTETGFGRNSGLGLAISRQIAAAHGGHIWAENRYSKSDGTVLGATFHVALPLT